MPRKNVILFTSLTIFLLLLGGCAWQNNFSLKPPIKSQQNKPENISASLSEVSQKEATLSINFGQDQVKTFTLEFLPDKTVYNLLEELANQNKINLETKQYDFGILIEAIDGIKNGQDNKYWLYYVNGQMAPVGVGEQKVKAGDIIEFRFEEGTF